MRTSLDQQNIWAREDQKTIPYHVTEVAVSALPSETFFPLNIDFGSIHLMSYKNRIIKFRTRQPRLEYG